MGLLCRIRRYRSLTGCFIPRDIQDAMHGDHVLAKIQRGQRYRRAAGRRAHRQSLGRAHPTVVGLFRYGTPQNVVLPYDVRTTR
jgi:exoribonuclease R